MPVRGDVPNPNPGVVRGDPLPSGEFAIPSALGEDASVAPLNGLMVLEVRLGEGGAVTPSPKGVTEPLTLPLVKRLSRRVRVSPDAPPKRSVACGGLRGAVSPPADSCDMVRGRTGEAAVPGDVPILEAGLRGDPEPLSDAL